MHQCAVPGQLYSSHRTNHRKCKGRYYLHLLQGIVCSVIRMHEATGRFTVHAVYTLCTCALAVAIMFTVCGACLVNSWSVFWVTDYQR